MWQKIVTPAPHQDGDVQNWQDFRRQAWLAHLPATHPVLLSINDAVAMT